jgi:hypothetical protein
MHTADGCSLFECQYQYEGDRQQEGRILPQLHDVLRLRGGGDDNDSPGVLGELVIILKNARSLSSDERLAELLEELSEVQWGVVLINESWREQ